MVRASETGIFIISNMEGKEMLRTVVKKGDNKIRFSNAFAAGVYMGKMMNGHSTEVARIVYQP